MVVWSTVAGAHGSHRPPGPSSGITIPNLTHGQMAVLADYRSDILDLAERQGNTHESFRRVMNYANIQFTMCMWGLVPGSVTDEESPFNECSHAYLAATRAVLLRMERMPGPHPHVDDLRSRIDLDMLRNHSALVLCRYSNESFNTAQVIYPNWSNVPQHGTSFVSFGGFGIFLAGGFFMAARLTRPPRARG